jgi:hypothetical protein
LYGSPARVEQIEVGYRVALVVKPRMTEADPNGMNVITPPVRVQAGQRRVIVAFIERLQAPVEDLTARPEAWSHRRRESDLAVGQRVLDGRRSPLWSGDAEVQHVVSIRYRL